MQTQIYEVSQNETLSEAMVKAHKANVTVLRAFHAGNAWNIVYIPAKTH